MAGGVGHTDGLINPRPWRGRCHASYSNTGGPPLPRKRAPFTKTSPSQELVSASASSDTSHVFFSYGILFQGKGGPPVFE